MAEDTPIHVPRETYPESTYPTDASLMLPDDDSLRDTTLIDYLHVLLSRKWTVLAVLFTVVIGTLIYSLRQTPVYRATTSIQIDREDPNILTFKGVYEIESTTDDSLQTQFKILESRALARSVIEDLGLQKTGSIKPQQPGIFAQYMEMFKGSDGKAKPGQPEPDSVRPYIESYLNSLTVTPVRQARLVNVSFDSEDPDLAARIINSHARHFAERNLQFKWDATQQASEFLREQLTGLKANLEKAEDQLQAYSRANEILFTVDGRNTAEQKLEQLEAQFTKAQSDRFDKESYQRVVEGGNPDTLPQLMNNAFIANLSSRLAELQQQDSESAVMYSEEYPRRQRIRGQIEQIKKSIEDEKTRIVRTVSSEFKAAAERERLALAALVGQRRLVNKTNQEIIQYSILKREVETSRLIYDGLTTRLKEAQVSAGLRASNIRIVDRAETPMAPISPRKTLNMIAGLFAGLFLGVGLAFVQEQLDNSIKLPEEATKFLKVPALGLIPRLGANTGLYSYYSSNKPQKPDEQAKVELITHSAPSSAVAEAYRSMRTSLMLSFADRAPRSIVVTSAVPSEGKTVTAVNTAISLTQMGSRVVLVDADMRKPRVHTIFDLQPQQGLSSFLTGTASLKDVIHETEVPNLFLLPCGIIPPNPGELILSTRFRQLMGVLEQYFDFVVLDSPPLTNVSDAQILASSSDAVILVIKSGATSRHLVKRAVARLRESRTRIAGIVLNDMNLGSRNSYYSYYSSRYGTYGTPKQ